MPDKYLLDKAIIPGTIYRTEPDAFYVVRKVGTTSTTKAALKVEGAIVFETIKKIAEQHEVQNYKFPPFDLGELYAVIPPDKVFEMTGESAKFLRLIGELWMLRPGESMPPVFSSRFTEQPHRYYTYQYGLGGIGASSTWSDKAEYATVDYTVPAGEKHKYNRFVRVARTGIAVGYSLGKLGIRFYIDDKPLDVHDPAKGPLAIDTYCGHAYHYTDYFFYPLSMEDMPIELAPGHKLTIKGRNISGADITTGAGEECKVDVYIIDEKAYI